MIGAHVLVTLLLFVCGKNLAFELLDGGLIELDPKRSGATSSRDGCGSQNAFEWKPECPWISRSMTSWAPPTIWYEFPEPQTVVDVSFRTWDIANITDHSSMKESIERDERVKQNPTSFAIVGGDSCPPTTIIATVSAVKWQHHNQSFSLSLKPEQYQRSRCFGIRVNRVLGMERNGKKDGPFSAALRDFTIFTKDIKKEAVDLSQGEIGATSVLAAKFAAANAFKRAFFKSRSDRSFPWISVGIPATVYIKLPNAVKVSVFSFRSRPEPIPEYKASWILKYPPQKFELVGSDDCEKWTTILRVNSTKWTTFDEEKKWEVPEEKRKLFPCIGFKVLANGRTNNAAIQDAKFWKEPQETDEKGVARLVKTIEVLQNEVVSLKQAMVEMKNSLSNSLRELRPCEAYNFTTLPGWIGSMDKGKARGVTGWVSYNFLFPYPLPPIVMVAISHYDYAKKFASTHVYAKVEVRTVNTTHVVIDFLGFSVTKITVSVLICPSWN